VHARRPTIADVARSAGVSKGSVSLALNGRPGVSDATRVRIMAAADELGWRPSARAKALSESRALAIGLILARDAAHLAADPFFPQLLSGIETELSGSGYVLVLSVVPDERIELETYTRLARDGRIDGVLLTDARLDDARYSLVAELGLAAVVIGHPDPASGLPAVTSDQRTAVARAVGKLVALGHRRIAHVSGMASLVHSAERFAAWRDALLVAGLTPSGYVESDFTHEGGADATRRLLAETQPPTAIMYSNDLMAIGGLGVARELGVRVPQDLSIIGFDDVPIAVHVHPSLTTIRQDFVFAGAAATRRLLQRLEGLPISPVGIPDPQLIIRDSIGPAP
jgi:DNA-binding LacI/PurR family transcriptional regulator